MADLLGNCRDCGDEIDVTDGRDICDVCEYDGDVKALEDEFHADEPVWYTLSDLIERVQDLPTGPWQELMALAQILHDLRIHDTDALMRQLSAVYIVDDDKPLRGEYYYIGKKTDPDRHHSEIGAGHAPKEAKEPMMSNRRKAIMAQKEKKNEGN
jgi:hypothetical protein